LKSKSKKIKEFLMLIKRKLTVVILIGIFLSTGSLQTFSSSRDRDLKVMTYNMYLGAELGDIFTAQSPPEVLLEVGEAYTDMLAGNVPERIAAIADQIEEGGPVLVGLQEVALWRVGAPFDPAPATNVTYDFLDMLLCELASRNLRYAPIAIQTNLDAELPGILSPTAALDIRYTDRIAILARTDLQESEFKLEQTDARNFATNLQVPVLGQTVTVLRGWTSADVKFRGKPYRFVNAHLESFFDLVQYAQANELLQGPATTERAFILVGDFNSDAETGGVSYQIFTGAGLRDVWAEVNPGNPGFTWALSGEIPSDDMTPTERLDLILTRGPISFSGADVVGEEPGDKTPSGFRPSDHAGVIASVILEP
jgi:endonuclease/exonuclease/phosphatase family metal-dependent hydrolase